MRWERDFSSLGRLARIGKSMKWEEIPVKGDLSALVRHDVECELVGENGG